MAGAKFEIEIDDRGVQDAFDRLLKAGESLEPAFRNIGEYLLISHRERFRAQESPDGKPWAQLADSTLRRKMLRGVRREKGGRRSLTGADGSTRIGAIRALGSAKILIDRGYLVGSLTYAVSPDRLVFGTPMIYGATHQFGDPERNIPARPFLGVSDRDRGEIFDILQRHISWAWEG
jgi:phage gpG-like protein